jgi:hypothetical protein
MSVSDPNVDEETAVQSIIDKTVAELTVEAEAQKVGINANLLKAYSFAFDQ